MRASTELVISASLQQPGVCRVTWARESAPLAFRRSGEAVYLVGTAASPVADDAVSLKVTLERDARLKLRSAASMIAWAGTGSSFSIDVEIGPGASLDWHLQPLVASGLCNFTQWARASLAPGARLRWVEEVVLGRHGEVPGALDLRLDVDAPTGPLLRQQLQVGGPACGWDGPAVLGAHRTFGFVLAVGEGPEAVGPTNGEGWARMALEGDGTILQAVAGGLAELRRRLALSEADAATRPG